MNDDDSKPTYERNNQQPMEQYKASSQHESKPFKICI